MLLAIDSNSHEPLYLQIRNQIRERIVAGGLKVGDRLEASRALAKQLGVHRTTVGNAYAELEAEGLIQGAVGRGTFVSPFAKGVVATDRSRRQASNDFFWDSFFIEEPREDSLARLMAAAFQPGVISFAATHGSADLNPADLVRRATDAVLRHDGAHLLDYGSSDGYPPLKKHLQGRLGRDGIAAELDEILITNGCQQSFDLVRRSMVAAGDAIACDNPTYTGLWRVFDSPGVRLIGVPVGPHGMDLDFLTAALEQNKVKLILANPNFQNPTGRTMSLEARKRLLDLAVRFQVPVVEDDIYGGLRYFGRDLPSLKALDQAGLVIYLNSFSKVGFPGLRVGWMVASQRVIERLRGAKQRADLHTNLLGQAVLNEIGRRGWLDKWIRRTRRHYAMKLDFIRAAMARHFPPEARCTFPEGGMAVWVELPPGLDAAELLVKAQDQKVNFAPSRYFYFQQPQRNAFRLCFTTLPNEQIEKGIDILGSLLRAEVRKAGTRRNSAAMANVALV